MQFEKTSPFSKNALLFMVLLIAAGQMVETGYSKKNIRFGAVPQGFVWNAADYYYGAFMHKIFSKEVIKEEVFKDLSDYDYKAGYGIRS